VPIEGGSSISSTFQNSNHTFQLKTLHNGIQFVECFIAEQNMVGVGIGAGQFSFNLIKIKQFKVFGFSCRDRTIPFLRLDP
jgi:hypothetical protein